MNRIIFSTAIAVLYVIGLHIGTANALSMGLQDVLVEKGELLWLSPKHTENVSYNLLLSNFENNDGNDYFGLRYATSIEVSNLVSAYFGDLRGPINDHQDLFNAFYDDFCPGEKSLAGLIVRDQEEWEWGWEPGVGLNFETAWFEFLMISKYEDVNQIYFDTWPRLLDNPRDGWWLVYDRPDPVTAPVPEPASILLLGAGFLSLLIKRRLQK